MNLKPNTVFGQYRLVRLLGRGGMGEVYEAEHQVLQRRYALKLLPHDFAARSEAVQRFEREARVMANLEHPHIVRVDDFGQTSGRYWLRMELVKGLETVVGADLLSGPGGRRVRPTAIRCVTLGDYAAAQGGRIEPADFAVILRQLLDALAYAHGKGVVHRDLKPGNILLETDGGSGLRVKVSDFGLARVVGEDFIRSQAQISVSRSVGSEKTLAAAKSVSGEPTLTGEEGTSTRALLGTWEYMAPEQKRGEEADPRSDVFAVGLMSCRLLTGQEPGLKMPSRLVEGLCREWDGFLERALEQSPPARYGSGAEMLAAFTKAHVAMVAGEAKARGEQAATPEAAENQPPKQNGRSWPWTLGVALAAVLAVIGGLAWWLQKDRKAGHPSEPPVWWDPGGCCNRPSDRVECDCGERAGANQRS
jgi:serine/threonine-protein kinase